MAIKLQPSKAPNLILAPAEYAQQNQQQFLNMLRLYFNQLDNNMASLLSNEGGAYLRFPNGAFHQDGVTTLTTSISTSSTTPIVVASTIDFLPSGVLLIDSELIRYTGKTLTSFTGITRAAYGSSSSAHTAGVYVSEAQPVPSSAVPLTIALTKTDVSNQVVLNPNDNTQVIHQSSGYYNIQFSIQLASYDNTIDNVTVWFRQNGIDVPNSGGIVSVPTTHAGIAGTALLSWNIVLPINGGDYIQMMMTSDSGNSVAITYPPGVTPVHPSSPSIILTSTFVSALYL